MKHLLSVDDLGAARRASRRCSTSPTRSSRCTQRDIPKVPALRGKTVVSLFYEDSTRTRLSFETAAKRLVGRHDDVLGLDVVGEEGREPARHRADDRGDGHRRDRRAARGGRRAAPRRGVDRRRASSTRGDGRHEHPTQALLDAFTLRRHRGPSLDGCRVAIVGDIRNSRVAAEQREGVPRARLRAHARRSADADARTARRLAGHRRRYDLDDVLARRRRRLPPAHPARTHRPGAVPVDPRVRAAAGVSPRSARRG